MGVFIQAPFWATGYRRQAAPHAVSVLVVEPVIEPITVDEGRKYARDDFYDSGLMENYIRAARSQVEQETGLALLTQTRDVYFDMVSGAVIQLPAQSMPLQSVTSVKTTDTAGAVNTLATDQYVVDVASGRIALSETGVWPTDLQGFQPWVIRLVSGWTAAALIPPLLVHAVGLLTAHYATLGRDLASIDAATEVPYGYGEAIGPYKTVTLA